MTYLCEHEFVQPDPNYSEHSMMEFDLAAKLGLSLRKNLKTGLYEIFSLQNQDIVLHTHRALSDAVAVINTLEENNSVEIGCGIGCPLGNSLIDKDKCQVCKAGMAINGGPCEECGDHYGD